MLLSRSFALVVAGVALSAFCTPAHAQAAPEAPVEPPSAKAGAELFAKSGCTFCHGPAGAGTDKAPNIREVRKRKTDEEIFRQIHDGGKMMPPFGEALSESEIRSIVLFLRAKDGWELLPKDAAK